MSKNSNSNKKLSKLFKMVKESLGNSFDLASKVLIVEQVWEKKSGKTIVVLWCIFLAVLVVIKIVEEESIENFLSRIQEFVTFNQYLLSQLVNETVKRINAESKITELERQKQNYLDEAYWKKYGEDILFDYQIEQWASEQLKDVKKQEILDILEGIVDHRGEY